MYFKCNRRFLLSLHQFNSEPCTYINVLTILVISDLIINEILSSRNEISDQSKYMTIAIEDKTSTFGLKKLHH